MRDIFNKTGVKAGIAKFLYVLSMLPANAVSDMKNIYGKVILSKSLAKLLLLASFKKPGAKIIIRIGLINTPIIVIKNKISPNVAEV